MAVARQGASAPVPVWDVPRCCRRTAVKWPPEGRPTARGKQSNHLLKYSDLVGIFFLF